MKSLLFSSIRGLLRIGYIILNKFHLTNPSVIVMVDGGLCSQMHQYLLGQIIKSKGQEVEYDLLFYKTGLDLNGQHTRLFLLNKLFPDIIIREASSFKTKFYKYCFCNYGNYPHEEDTSWLRCTAPVYLTGYYSDIKSMFHINGVFSTIFKLNNSILSPGKLNVLNRIITDQSVGVHVRRGDLTDYNVAYGYPVTIDYILSGIKFFLKERVNPVFYFFSDDREYVIKNIIPSIGSEIKYWVSDSEYDKVHEDFLLLSCCKDLITSKGTMGKYCALFNNATTVVLSKDDKQEFILESLNSRVVKI